MIDLREREYPKRYIDMTIDILGSVAETPVIVETGCCRQHLFHDIDKEVCPACCDGHSTYLWARTGWRVITVDISGEYIKIAREICSGFDNVEYYTVDAIKFAKAMMPRHVDLLFLDAWDVELPESADKHLEFYKTIKPRLLNDPMVLIDDTDIYHDGKEFFYDEIGLSGKGRELIPVLIKEGYEIIFRGRQTLLRKK